MLIKGISKQNAGKRCSKVNKFESDKDTNNSLGPILPKGSTLFKDLHFLLTCTDPPNPRPNQRKVTYIHHTYKHINRILFNDVLSLFYLFYSLPTPLIAVVMASHKTLHQQKKKTVYLQQPLLIKKDLKNN